MKKKWDATNVKLGVVCAKFYQDLSDQLLQEIEKCFLHYGGYHLNLKVTYVPGAFEIPQVTQKLVNSKKYDAIITVGIVIQGDTRHFDYVCAPVSQKIADISVSSGIPVIFGILTTDNKQQVVDRITGSNNKGWGFVESALHMISILDQI